MLTLEPAVFLITQLLLLAIAAGATIVVTSRSIAESPRILTPHILAPLALASAASALSAVFMWQPLEFLTRHDDVLTWLAVATYALGLGFLLSEYLTKLIFVFAQPAHDHLLSLEVEQEESDDWQSDEWRAADSARIEAEHGRSYSDPQLTVRLRKRERRRPRAPWTLCLHACTLAYLFGEKYSHVLHLLTQEQEEPRRRYELATGRKLL